ncbi:MAG: hypothetical protein K6F05_08385 [Succinivibrio sp.]|nr:hypothetical protein [Succinivibrio sp.]
MFRKLLGLTLSALVCLNPAWAEQVIINKLQIQSELEVSPGELRTLTSSFEGRQVSVELLREILSKVTRFYQDHGHPSSKAFLPEQDSLDGNLIVKVLEPKVKNIRLDKNLSTLTDRTVQRLLGFSGKDFPKDYTLEDIQKKLLLLSDLNSTTPQGYFAKLGDSSHVELNLELQKKKTFNAEVFIDNHGNKYSGNWRTGLLAKTTNLSGNSDSASIFLAGSNERQRNATISYAIPINSYFTSIGASLCYSSYELAGKYRELGAKGKALSAAVFVHQPLLRALDHALAANVALQYRKDEDEFSTFELKFKRHVVNANFELEGFSRLTDKFSFENRTGLLLGKISDDSGYFEKAQQNYALVHSQMALAYQFNSKFTLLNELKLQLANHNVDNSDALELSGPDGVQAYAAGTALGDSGYVNSFSLNYRPSTSLQLSFAPHLDFGLVRNQDGGDSTHLAGLGFKIQYFQNGFFAKLALQKALGHRPEGADEKVFLVKFGYQYV